MKISFTLLILIAGTSLATAAEVPKEGTYDYIACYGGTMAQMKMPDGKIASTLEWTGGTHSNVANSPFDNNSFKCIGAGISAGVGKGWTTGRLYCTATDTDGDIRAVSFVIEDGKGTRHDDGGTGKFEGLTTTGTKSESFAALKPAADGTIQECSHQTGSYKIGQIGQHSQHNGDGGENNICTPSCSPNEKCCPDVQAVGNNECRPRNQRCPNPH